MNSAEFNEVIMDQLQMCLETLGMKAGEYAANDNRLHNFENAAGMMGCDRKEALAGMMAKHTISIYDMCRSGKDYPYELWCEKIQDHINYLLLLKAIVVDDELKKREQEVKKNLDDIPDLLNREFVVPEDETECCDENVSEDLTDE